MQAGLAMIVKRAGGANADDSRYPRTWLFHRRWGRRGGGEAGRRGGGEAGRRRAASRSST